jgi:DNA polymerase-3 subunit alpha (Gram-positive type)
VRPERLKDANPESLAISGYDEKEWADAVDLKTALEEFLSYTEGCMLVGQNIGVDMMHLKNGLERCGLTPNYFYKGIDTFTLAWSKLLENKEIRRFSLSELAPHFGVDAGTQHRALDDARTTYRVFLKLLGR